MTTERDVTLPGNPRYQPKSLQPIFGYDNLYRGVGRVEIANLQVLGKLGVIPENEAALLTQKVINDVLNIRTTDVDHTERTVTQHDILAWKLLAQDVMPEPLRRWVHILLTSYDPIGTGQTLQFVEAHRTVVMPLIRQVVGDLATMVVNYADQLQIGRTHGQAALPITVGFWLATILNRILYNAVKIDEHANQLVGKISGAVGAYNAQVGLGILNRCGHKSYEVRVLEKLGLNPAPISTQILPPKPMTYYLISVAMLSAALGQLGRDCRHLMRTEIAEVQEAFASTQGGSSTMAHKRNPISFEGLEGAWLRTKNEFGKVLDGLISEHQRDLVGSSLMRDYPIMVINLVHQLEMLMRPRDGVSFLLRMSFNQNRCKLNFDRSAHLVLAEPLYIALQMAGYEGDAHRLINHTIVPKAMASGRPLIDELRGINDKEIQSALTNIPQEVIQLFSHPERYTGLASRKAYEIANTAQQLLNKS